MSLNPIEIGINAVLTSLGATPPRAHQLLDERLAALARCAASQAAAIEQDIWTLWCSHDDAAAAAAMRSAIAALGNDDRGAALRTLDRLVADWPDWPEAWNKRATLHFMAGRNADSLADIVETLRLEPRHFGAICGFGQICLRAANPAAALMAFEHALTLHPNLTAIRQAATQLRRQTPLTVH